MRAELAESQQRLAEAQSKLAAQQAAVESTQRRFSEMEEQYKDVQQRERVERARHTEEADVLLAKVQELNTALQMSSATRDRAQEQCRQLQKELEK